MEPSDELVEAMPVENATYTGINLDLGFFPLAFFLYLCTPSVQINGYPKPFSWGRHFVPLEPGTYDVKIWFPYLFIKECGANSTQVTLNEGEVRNIQYYMWPFVLLPGSITVS